MDQAEIQKLELFISCRALKDLDTLTVSDPYVVMLVQNQAKWFEHGRTEKIDNNLNPNFAKSMTIEYHFEVQQHLRFEVYHYVDERQSKLIGRTDTTLSAIVGSKDQLISLPLYDDTNSKGGTIIVRADQVKDCADQVTLHLRGNDIVETRFWFWHSTNPFLRFYRLRKDDPNPVLVYETEQVVNNKNPVWQPIVCKAQKLCNGDYFMPIKIELWDYRNSGQHVLLGETAVSLDQLRNGEKQKQFQNKQNKNKVVGTLQVTQFVLNQKSSFIDFLQGGLQLNLLVAIDFTASNKNINDITSLHYQDPKGIPSLYEQAIVSVGDILINYDYDKKVPVYGFGCKPKLNIINTNETLHCFPLNDNPDDPEVYGLQGIVQVYRDTVRRLGFDGPTYLHPVLQQAMQQAREIKDKKQDNYLILLILTDGQTNDLQITIDDVIASSHLPLSIILIGIGNADFRNMEVLDNDDLSMVDSNGKKSQRDLVQFVPFNKYNGDAALLSREVLQELPDQVVEYMELTKQPPKPAKGMKLSQYQMPSNQNSQQVQYPQIQQPYVQSQQIQQQQQQQYQQPQLQNFQQQQQYQQQQQQFPPPIQFSVINPMIDDAQSQKIKSQGVGTNVLSQGMAQSGYLSRFVSEVPAQQVPLFNQNQAHHYPPPNH